MAGVPARPGQGSSRAVGWAGFVVAVIALAAAVAIFFQVRIEQGALDRLHAALVSQRSGLDRLDQEEVTSAQFAHLAQGLQAANRDIRQLTHTVSALSTGVREARIGSRIREAEMLLTLARRILVLEPNRTRAALRVLETVRGLIRPLADPALEPAQKILEERIRLLQAGLATEKIDPARVLGSLSLASPGWPLAIPRPPHRRGPLATRIQGGFWSRFAAGVSAIFHDLVRIHRVPIRPSPPPGARAARLVRLDLALDLSLAQTAWLTADRRAYVLELGLLRDLIAREYDRSDPRVLAGWRKLGALERAPWHPVRPGWQPLLRALHSGDVALRRGRP